MNHKSPWIKIGNALLSCLVFCASYTMSFLFCLVGVVCAAPTTEEPMATVEALFILIAPLVISFIIASKYSKKCKEKRAMTELMSRANVAEPTYTAPAWQYNSSEPVLPYRSGVEDQLSQIDFMEGHDFEYWCAALLRKIGFCNVEVTQGSGDQGVDVLAEKDGIRYAIQCKCYSKDLGNSPVQEVSSGKMMPQYHCQVGAVMTNRYFTKGAKELAEATGTLLWGREWIASRLKETEPKPIEHTQTNYYNYSSQCTEYDHAQLLPGAVDVILESGQASVSILQRKLNLGYAQASRVLKELEELGIVGPFNGSTPRKILISKAKWARMKRWII